jgi:hypothetical protein
MTQMVSDQTARVSKPGLRIDVAAVALGVLILATTVLKFTLYARQPLGLDETFTGMIAGQPDLRALLHQCQLDVYAPLSYLVSWAWAQVSGLSDAALRFPSAVFACLAPLVALAPSRLMPKSVRLTWAALLACWYPGLVFGQIARCYSLVLLIGAINSVTYVWLLRRPTLKRALVWCGVSSLFILDHYFAAILVGCQGVAYLAIHREKALRTWPAALVFAPAFASIALKAALLTGYARPGVSWMAPLHLADVRDMAQYLAGTTVAEGYVLIWLVVGLCFRWRTSEVGRAPASDDAQGAILITSLLALLATAICLAIGFWKPIVIARYLTAVVPGLMLGLALIAHRFGRSWTLAPAALVAGFAGLVFVLLFSPIHGRSAFSIEDASNGLMAHKPRALVFLWDNPLAQTDVGEQFSQVGGFFFKRAGHPINVDAPRWANGTNPNLILLAHARSPGTAILWVYDVSVPGTLAIRYPPNLTRLDPTLHCQDYGGSGIGVLACDRQPPHTWLVAKITP